MIEGGRGLFDLKESRFGGIKVGKALSQCHMDIKIQVKIQAKVKNSNFQPEPQPQPQP
jgi:hypothetical protein